MMMKKTTFLQRLFARLHCKRAPKVLDRDEPVVPDLCYQTIKDDLPDSGGDVWDITLDTMPANTAKRMTVVGARKQQHETQPERCA